ncbi:MAG: T9SS type A sorting domain-containing protein [Bacteroidales bacterium]|nr:T9SS type A sorting domain-containing protein [Bacteroidales bacterium]
MRTKFALAVLTCCFFTSFAQWQPTKGLYSGDVHSVIISNNEIIVGSKQIYKSLDNGMTWNVSNNGISGSVSAIRSLVKISTNIVAGTDAGVFYSADNGNSWTVSAGTSSLNVWSMVVKGTNVFLSTLGSGIYKSINNGQNWSACNTGITTPLVDIRFLTIKGTDIYAGSDGRGIYKSTNDGGSWTTSNTGLPGSYYAIVGLAVVGNNIIAGTGGAGVYKSTNDGANWSSVNNGISSTDYIMDMSVNGSSIYASTLTGNLYKTTDYINWNAVSPGNFTATRFEAFFQDGTDFFVGTWGFGSPEQSYGLFKTPDDGQTWNHIGITDYPVSCIEMSGSNILAGTYDVSVNTSRIPLFRTTETDSVWNFNIGGFAGSNITALKSNGAVVYLFDFSGSGQSQVYRSTNNGNNWTSTGYNALYNKFVKFVIAGSLIYAADDSNSSSHVYVSSDNGQTWTAVNTGLSTSIVHTYDIVLKGTTLFLGTDHGVYKNTVGQNNWTAVNSGLTNMYVKAMWISGADIYAGTQGGGIFKSTNDGAQWIDVSTGIPLFTNITCFTGSVTNIFAGTDNGVFHSTNGTSWTSVSTGLIDTAITALNVSNNYLWAGTTAHGVWRRELSQLIGAIPPTPGVITGSTSVCQGSTNTYSVAPVSGATSYTWTLPNGWTGTSTSNSINATGGTSGNITVTANNSYGSSSAQTLTINVISVNTSVTQSGMTFTANATGASYVWLNCNGFTVISGANMQSYTATVVGSYAVIITQNGCSDTSACLLADTTCYTTITGADLPHAGLSVLLAVDSLSNVSVGNSGVSQSWNYSSLSPSYMKYAVYDATSSTPYASTFSASNIYTYGPGYLFGSLYGGAPVGTGDNGYVFWKSDNTGLWTTGFRPDGGICAGTNVHDNPHELLIGAPASYGSVFNNYSRWELPINANIGNIDTFYVKVVTKTITADACGSITTPFGFYPNVLRQHEYAISIDSVYMKMGGTLITSLEFSRDTSNNYMYIANGIGYPVCIVHANKNNVVKDVEYYAGVYSGINKEPEDITQIIVYPNPTTGIINIEIPINGSSNAHQIILYNSIGASIKQIITYDNFVNIDLSGLSKGVYLVKVIGNEFTITQKIIFK